MKITKRMNFNLQEFLFNEMIECGLCGSWHPIDYYGDCRDDDYRYHPDDLFHLLKEAPNLLKACQCMIKAIEFEQNECNQLSNYTENFVKAVDNMSQAIIKAVDY